MKKSKDNITRDSKYWWWCPKHKMEGKFYFMYINHPPKQHGYWKEEKQNNIEALKSAGPRVQGIVETPVEKVEAENATLCCKKCSIHCALTGEYPRLKLQELLDSKTSQTRGPG